MSKFHVKVNENEYPNILFVVLLDLSRVKDRYISIIG